MKSSELHNLPNSVKVFYKGWGFNLSRKICHSTASDL